MSPFLQRLFRGAVLGLMLLLAGTANLVSFSYDADDDDDTPPISIEVSLAAPCKKSMHVVPKLQCDEHAFRPSNEKPVPEMAAFPALEAATLLDKGSPQLMVPLRT